MSATSRNQTIFNKNFVETVEKEELEESHDVPVSRDPSAGSRTRDYLIVAFSLGTLRGDQVRDSLVYFLTLLLPVLLLFIFLLSADQTKEVNESKWRLSVKTADKNRIRNQHQRPSIGREGVEKKMAGESIKQQRIGPRRGRHKKGQNG